MTLGTSLSSDQQSELTTQERVIDRWQRGSLEAGKALLKIRDARLYRDKYSTFEDYCHQRWGFGRSYGHRLVQAAEVVQSITREDENGVSPRVNTAALPSSEGQVRPLVIIDAKDRPAAWEKANELANGRTITASIVKKAASPFLKTPRGAKPGSTVKSRTSHPHTALQMVDEVELAVRNHKTEQHILGLIAKLKVLLRESNNHQMSGAV